MKGFGTLILKPPLVIVSFTKRQVSKVKDRVNQFPPYGGPFGTIILTFLLPEIVYLVNHGCNEKTCIVHNFPPVVPGAEIFLDPFSYLFIISWLIFQYALARMPIGAIECGHPIRNGQRLPYRLNGTYSLVITLGMMGFLSACGLDVTILYEKLESLMGSAIIITFILSIALFIKSKHIPEYRISDDGYHSDNFLYNFFVGRELNPRIGRVDLKLFFETRPGLLLWIVLDLCLLKRSLDTSESPPVSLVIVVVAQLLFVFSRLHYEVAMLSNVSIVHEGLGFVHIFRHFVWVPFTYSVMTRYILEHKVNDNVPFLVFAVILNLIGLLQCRLANRQSTVTLRRHGLDTLWWRSRHLTESRNRLFSSLGMVRNPDFFGQLILVIAWSFVSGRRHLPTYMFPLYAFIVTLFRIRRETGIYRRKYGQKWSDFCTQVPSILIPGIY